MKRWRRPAYTNPLPWVAPSKHPTACRYHEPRAWSQLSSFAQRNGASHNVSQSCFFLQYTQGLAPRQISVPLDYLRVKTCQLAVDVALEELHRTAPRHVARCFTAYVQNVNNHCPRHHGKHHCGLRTGLVGSKLSKDQSILAVPCQSGTAKHSYSNPHGAQTDFSSSALSRCLEPYLLHRRGDPDTSILRTPRQ